VNPAERNSGLILLNISIEQAGDAQAQAQSRIVSFNKDILKERAPEE
jgi:hypothetical protein